MTQIVFCKKYGNWYYIGEAKLIEPMPTACFDSNYKIKASELFVYKCALVNETFRIKTINISIIDEPFSFSFSAYHIIVHKKTLIYIYNYLKKNYLISLISLKNAHQYNVLVYGVYRFVYNYSGIMVFNKSSEIVGDFGIHDVTNMWCIDNMVYVEKTDFKKHVFVASMRDL
jgi:hypothetical protein